jgi:hypothetical protein
MKPRLVLFLLSMLFVFAQFVSIEQTTSFMTCMAELDDVDDLSLEDVVPVDPFLAPPDAKPDDCVLPPAPVAPGPDRVAALPDSSAQFLRRLARESKVDPPEPRLWLLNRNLLI